MSDPLNERLYGIARAFEDSAKRIGQHLQPLEIRNLLRREFTQIANDIKALKFAHGEWASGPEEPSLQWERYWGQLRSEITKLAEQTELAARVGACHHNTDREVGQAQGLREVIDMMDKYIAPPPQTETLAEAFVPHYENFRIALRRMYEATTSSTDQAYWQHEMKALDHLQSLAKDIIAKSGE